MTRSFPRVHTVMLSLAALVLLFTGLFGNAGCFVGVRADPNDPIYGNRQFALEPIAYANLMIGDKPEPVYLGEKKPEQQQSFEADKAELARLLGEHLTRTTAAGGIALVPAGNPAPFVLRINIDFIEPGNFNGFVNFPTEVRMSLSVINSQGQLISTNPLTAQVAATLYNPSSGGRMRSAGEKLGIAAGHYLLRRTGLGY